jgi:hypothetical protein
MMELTLNLPDPLAAQLQSVGEDEWPRIIEIGIRERNTSRLEGFRGLSEVLETLARLPSSANGGTTNMSNIWFAWQRPKPR